MATEAEPVISPESERFGRVWRMERLLYAIRRRVDLDFAYPTPGLTAGFTDSLAVKTINTAIAGLYLDILQEGLPSESGEALQHIQDLRDRLYRPPNVDFSWLPF